jgi:peptidoglycan pentaglycine glycine transferase (the first glycine)
MKAKYSVRLIKGIKQYRKFLLEQDFQLYVQTPEYGIFSQNLGYEYFILGVYKEEKLVAATLVLDIKARRGRFYFLPYGPILDYSNSACFNALIKSLKNYAKRNKVDFIRISPFSNDNQVSHKLLKDKGFKRSPMHMLAETTWLLDLTPDKETLLKNMKQNHRNLIRRQEKLGIRIEKSTNIKDIQKVHKLLVETSKRHAFTPFSPNYLEKEFKAFKKLKGGTIYLGYYGDELVAAAITYAYGNTTAYKHGASNMKYKKIPVSYCIQWQAIQDAKARGCKYYNFWGIAPNNAEKSHPFYGITHFKKGFGGFQKDLLPAFDLKISYKYYINLIVELFRKYKRGFN